MFDIYYIETVMSTINKAKWVHFHNIEFKNKICKKK